MTLDSWESSVAAVERVLIIVGSATPTLFSPPTPESHSNNTEFTRTPMSKTRPTAKRYRPQFDPHRRPIDQHRPSNDRHQSPTDQHLPTNGVRTEVIDS
ncbi:hypothetical protein [Haladaptatus pallidirubidus]|uniref:hypothetical protein n=2 Tax=Haladaptatus pallidirubidus TaxID=1008152 RepID=UPI0036F315BB